MSVSVGVAFDGLSPLANAVAMAREAEAAGVGSLWVAEHLGYREATLTAMALLGATERLRIVPTALSPYARAPIITAMAAATLAEAGPERVGLAIGVGNPLFLEESGLAASRPLRAVAEYLECLRQLWSGQQVRYQGELFQLAGASLSVPLAAPIPLYVAAIKERMLALAGRLADGVVLSAGLSPAYVSESLERVADGARAAGRDPAALRGVGFIYTAVSPDGREAVEAVRAKLAFLLRNRYLADNVRQSGLPIDQAAIIAAVARRDLETARRLVPDDAIEAFAIAGTPQQARARLETFVAAGLREPVLSITGSAEHRHLALALPRDYQD
jgi:5,10-methylenetetrahydromethanopterin reductase